MADPFEVRMRFTNQLTHLNASTTSAMKAANYAIRYTEFSDDLFSCILEQLERTNMNLRANIMYFLPALCEASRAHGDDAAGAYVRMMQRDVLRIIDLVAPDDGSGAANVKVVRRVLHQLQAKRFLEPPTVAELEDYIAARDSAPASPHRAENVADALPPPPPPAAAAVVAPVPVPSATHSTPLSVAREPPTMHPPRLDKRQIEQRIEEDRERHKRAREGIWAVQQTSGTPLALDAEFDRLWRQILDVADDDRLLIKEEMEERRRCVDFEEV